MNPITGFNINPYFLALVGGLLAFAIVWLLAGLVLSNRRRYKYALTIEMANDELLGVIIPLVIDKRLPRKPIIDSFRISIAKKYGINPDVLISNSEISQEIINLSMVSPLLRNDQKVDLCDNAQRIESYGELEHSCSCSTRENPILASFAVILGILAGAHVIITTILVSCKDPGFSGDFRNFIILFVLSIVLPILLLLLAHIPDYLFKPSKESSNKTITKDVEKEKIEPVKPAEEKEPEVKAEETKAKEPKVEEKAIPMPEKMPESDPTESTEDDANPQGQNDNVEDERAKDV